MSKSNVAKPGRATLARNFALSHGLRFGQVIHFCRTEQIVKVKFDRVLWNWVIFEPEKLILK